MGDPVAVPVDAMAARFNLLLADANPQLKPARQRRLKPAPGF
jgi:hypothetical protein